MASPFSVFRKNQKSFMVVLVIGSMIAFTGDSLFNQGGDNLTLLGVLVGTGLALLAGFQFGRPLHYAIGGAIAGGIIGYVVPSFTGGAGVDSSLGVFDQKRVDELAQRRRAANEFMAELQRRSIGMVLRVPFGNTYRDDPTRDIIIGDVFRAEAEEMGIEIDDEAVNRFINWITFEQLTPENFVEARKRVTIDGEPVSEKALYDLLRDEIQALVVRQTLVPFRDDAPATPEQYWQLYRQLNVRQQLAFTPVSVDQFLGDVGEPTESDIAELFEKYKARVPNQVEPGAPGFFQQRRIKIGYVEADYASVEKTIAAITEEDIAKYYEDNKDSFRKLVIPDDPEIPDDPDLPSLDDLDKEGETKEGETKEGETKEGDDKTSEGEGGTDKAAGEGTEEKADNADDKTGDQGAGTDDKSSGTNNNENGCGALQEDDGAAQESGEAKSADSQGSDDQGKAAAPASQDENAAVPPTPAGDEKAGDQTEDTVPGGTDPPDELLQTPPVEYKPLEEVRTSIENSIRRERTQEKIETLMAAALAYMHQLSDDRDERFMPGSEGKGVTDNELCVKLKGYAAANSLLYAETPLATAMELSDREEMPIGSATQPGVNQFSRQSLNVMQTLFGGGDTTSLFNPARAELLSLEFATGGANQYAYWAIAEVPLHEPKIDEAGVREQVVEAWKTEKARPLAEKRAKEIAASVRAELSEEKTMTDILEETTVTGSSDSPKLIVKQSQPFSWMQTSTAASPMGQPASARLSSIPGVRNPHNDFMKYIFNELEANEVGVIANYDKSEYYVVQPLSRFPSDEFDEQATLERFLKSGHFDNFSAMPGMVRRQYGEHNATWLNRLEAKYGLDWSVE